MNLNGWRGTITVSPTGLNELSQTPLIPATPVTVQGTQGTIGIKFAGTVSLAFTPGVFHHWVTMTDPTGNIYYYLNGQFSWLSP